MIIREVLIYFAINYKPGVTVMLTDLQSVNYIVVYFKFEKNIIVLISLSIENL